MEKLLIIGDKMARNEELLRVVEREEYEVLQASGGADGLEMVRTERPVVAIVDHYLQEGDGVDVLKQVREADPACEVILVTPGGEMDIALEILRAGALDYLRLPIDASQLRIALGRARERRPERKVSEPPVILVVEDHDPTRKRLVRILEKEGYRVRAAANGEEALQIFNERHLDLILADIRMPGMTGLNVLHETKGSGADVEVIMVTAYGDEDDVVQALRDGAFNFLRKPIDIDQMLLAIQKALDFQTVRRSLAYRDRDLALMQELVIRLTSDRELIVETTGKLSAKARDFLRELVDALPIGIVVVGADRTVLFVSRPVVDVVGESPTRLDTEWLEKMGIADVSDDQIDDALDRTLNSPPGTIETLVVSEWSFLVMTSVKLIVEGLPDKVVALGIRGERRPS